jgi:hypothetical protein
MVVYSSCYEAYVKSINERNTYIKNKFIVRNKTNWHDLYLLGFIRNTK